MIRFLVRFLGGIHLALFLIAALTLLTILGTLIESFSSSHELAVSLCYQNPFFQLLLVGFFINILLAALRRYPFRKKHIPFLLAHLGLLMILSGTFIKSRFGLQGSCALIEGGTTNTLMIDKTFALNLQTRENNRIKRVSIPLLKSSRVDTPIGLSLIEWSPHVEEKMEGWIKGGFACIEGIPPFPIHTYSKGGPLPIGCKARIDEKQIWNIYAFISNEIEEITKKLVREQKGPSLLLIKSNDGDEHLLALHPSYPPTYNTFSPNNPKEYIAFDKGYQGYGLCAELPTCTLFTSLTKRTNQSPLPLQRERQTPQIRLLTDDGRVVSLTYDQYGTHFSWPIAPGEWIGYFGAKIVPLPHTLRLQEARKIDYPGGDNSFSYECDLLIDQKEVTLSMNHVYQTKKGYRFYLANLMEGRGAKKIQLIVNYDPARYLLTYPGALVITLGIITLFWWKPKKDASS